MGIDVLLLVITVLHLHFHKIPAIECYKHPTVKTSAQGQAYTFSYLYIDVKHRNIDAYNSWRDPSVALGCLESFHKHTHNKMLQDQSNQVVGIQSEMYWE